MTKHGSQRVVEENITAVWVPRTQGMQKEGGTESAKVEKNVSTSEAASMIKKKCVGTLWTPGTRTATLVWSHQSDHLVPCCICYTETLVKVGVQIPDSVLSDYTFKS